MPEPRDVLADRYELIAPIATGGMATVWKARDLVLERTVAVKILDPTLAERDDIVARFRTEALAAAHLAHPNIVAIFDSGHLDHPEGCDFIVMEHCGGGTLAELMADRDSDIETLCGAAITVCEAIAFAHSNGVLHRDIKPANVLISDDGVLKVTDFGIAKAAFVEDDITTTGMVLGTVTYISPEQAQNHEPDHRSDIYSLGAVLYEMLTGRPPFQGESYVATAMMHIREIPPRPRTIRSGIPRALEDVVMKALAKDPAERFDSAEEMAQALRRGVPGARVPATTRRTSSTAARAPAPPDLRWIAPVVLLAIVAVVLAMVIPADPDSENERTNRRQPGDVLAVSAVEDFDPGGDGEEHGELVATAIDGDAKTVWKTESYDAALPVIKSGVGLRFDLGEEQEVRRVEILSPDGGYLFEVRAGSTAARTETGYELMGSGRAAAGSTDVFVTGDPARYWLIWIVDLPGGTGGSAAIGEVRFFGP
ncbi:MAG TPA: protein kinase [Actinomycetota bacterium]|nr:protein kinase [Actinomycetota bacterium]